MIEVNRKSIRMLGMLGSCGSFGIALLDAAESDSSIVAVTADLRSYSGLERFADAYPDRFYNVGIAEQNMVNIAAGMASEGLNVFASTYATFAAMRIADQVRTSMGYMQLPVKLVGLTAGYSVGVLGATHMSIEDIAVMRAIPNITIVSPADGLATYKATIAVAKHEGPVFLRLSGTMGFPAVYKEDFDFEIGKAQLLQKGSDVLLIATGSIVANSLRAAETLQTRFGVSCTVLDMATIRPLDLGTIYHHMQNKSLVAVVEEHVSAGGLGSALLESLCEADHPPFVLLSCPESYPHAASYDYLIQAAGLSADSIADSIARALDAGSLPKDLEVL